MAKINLTLPNGELAITGKQVTFTSPISSESATHLVIEGNEFELVDSNGNPISQKAFMQGALVSVILNVETKKAHIQNADTNAYLEGKLKELSNSEEWTFHLEDGSTVTKVVRLQ